MSFDVAVLIGAAELAFGIGTGVALRRRAAAQRTARGLFSIAAIAFAVGIGVVVTSNHADRLLTNPVVVLLLLAMLTLFYVGPLPIGFVIGSAFAFRSEPYGWLRIGIAIVGGLGVYVGSISMVAAVLQ